MISFRSFTVVKRVILNPKNLKPSYSRLITSCTKKVEKEKEDEEHNKCASTCWKCGSTMCDCCSIFCSSCKSIQELDLKKCNFFCLFGVNETFKLDDGLLEGEYKNLQKQLHPDKFAMTSNEERDRSSYNSSVVNQAYQVRLFSALCIQCLSICMFVCLLI